MNLKAFLEDRAASDSSLGEGLVRLLLAVASCCLEIAAEVRRDPKAASETLNDENVFGEKQKRLDVLADQLLCQRIGESGLARALASEENPDFVEYDSDSAYALLHDPLDGSSNIEVNIPTGTIFSVLPCPPEGPRALAGRDQVAAGYVLYGSATLLVLSVAGEAALFAFDEARAEFVLSKEALRIPEEASEFAINAANALLWDAPVADYVRDCQLGVEGSRGRKFNMRWVGSMVADFHRLMMRGGVFLYPRDSSMRAQGKDGKLRLMFELNPCALVVESAGGAATDGIRRLLDIEPVSLTQRCGAVLGCRAEVERIASRYRASGLSP